MKNRATPAAIPIALYRLPPEALKAPKLPRETKNHPTTPTNSRGRNFRTTVMFCIQAICRMPVRLMMAGIKVKELAADQFDDWLDERAEELTTRTLRLIHQILERAIRRPKPATRSAATWRAWSTCLRVRKGGHQRR
jgi:hypothetical protein